METHVNLKLELTVRAGGGGCQQWPGSRWVRRRELLL
jgi:hypothetical protein